MTHGERFDAVERHADFAAAMQHTPKVSVAFGIVAPLVFLAFSCFLFYKLWTDGPAPAGSFAVMLVVLPVLFAGVILYMLTAGVRFARAPIERVVAVVVDERTHVRRDSDGDRTTTDYATLERRDGNRSEHPTTSQVAGQVTRGDIGVAYLKGKRLVGFRRFAA